MLNCDDPSTLWALLMGLSGAGCDCFLLRPGIGKVKRGMVVSRRADDGRRADCLYLAPTVYLKASMKSRASSLVGANRLICRIRKGTPSDEEAADERRQIVIEQGMQGQGKRQLFQGDSVGLSEMARQLGCVDAAKTQVSVLNGWPCANVSGKLEGRKRVETNSPGLDSPLMEVHSAQRPVHGSVAGTCNRLHNNDSCVLGGRATRDRKRQCSCHRPPNLGWSVCTVISAYAAGDRHVLLYPL
jgi:hypothetical protein